MTALPTTTETGWTVAYRPARGRFLRRLPLDLTETAAEATALRVLAALGDDRAWEVHVVPNRQAELDGRVPEADHGTLIVRGSKGPRTLELREIDTPVALLLAVGQPQPCGECSQPELDGEQHDPFLPGTHPFEVDGSGYRTPAQEQADRARDIVLSAARAGGIPQSYPTAFGHLVGTAQSPDATIAYVLNAIAGIDQGRDQYLRERAERLRLAALTS